MAFLPGYSKYADLTVNGALMPGGGLSAAASGWQTVAIPADLLAACQGDLRDFRIADGTDGVTLVDYAIESVTSGIVWVRPAAWSSGTTTLRAYGGHLTAADEQDWPAVTAGWAGVWPLGDAGPTAVDVTGNGNNGTQSGGVTFGATGRVDGACSFDGASGLISAYNPANLAVFTMHAWASRSNGADAVRTILGGWGDGSQRWYLRQEGASGVMRLGVGAGSAATTTGVSNVGTMVAVTATWTGAAATIHIDGAERPVTSGGMTTSWPNEVLPIGCVRGWGAYQYYFPGTIDNVCIAPFACTADQARLLATYPGHASQSWSAVQSVPSASLIPWLIRRNRILGGGTL